MTCEHALELLLEADLGELDATGESPLAAHVRECAKCGPVAAQLAMDTRALARATGDSRVATLPPGGRRRLALRPVFAVGALAVAITFAVLRAARPGDDAARLAVAPPVSLPFSPTPSPTPEANAAAPVAPEPTGVRVAPRRFPDAVAATPVKLVASQTVAVHASAADDPSRITVTAPAGIRVAVLRTGNPAITVVWLY